MKPGCFWNCGSSKNSIRPLFAGEWHDTELNPALANAPELVNNDPYGEGWMIKMKISNTDDIKTLLDAKAYEQMVS